MRAHIEYEPQCDCPLNGGVAHYGPFCKTCDTNYKAIIVWTGLQIGVKEDKKHLKSKDLG